MEMSSPLYIGRRRNYVWWFSPHSVVEFLLLFEVFCLVVGEITQGRIINYSRSPLSEPDPIQDDGEIHRES